MTSVEKLLAESERLREAVTPLPWRNVDGAEIFTTVERHGPLLFPIICVPLTQWGKSLQHLDNAAYITHACNTNAMLCEIISIYREALKELSDTCIEWFPSDLNQMADLTYAKVDAIAAKALV